jgi:hypothetical protein
VGGSLSDVVGHAAGAKPLARLRDVISGHGTDCAGVPPQQRRQVQCWLGRAGMARPVTQAGTRNRFNTLARRQTALSREAKAAIEVAGAMLAPAGLRESTWHCAGLRVHDPNYNPFGLR